MPPLSKSPRETLEEMLMVGLKNRSLGDDGSQYTFKLLESLSDETIRLIGEAGTAEQVAEAIGNGISIDFPFMSAHNLDLPKLSSRRVTVTLMASIEIR